MNDSAGNIGNATLSVKKDHNLHFTKWWFLD
jgi:hypothetical protein